MYDKEFPYADRPFPLPYTYTYSPFVEERAMWKIAWSGDKLQSHVINEFVMYLDCFTCPLPTNLSPGAFFSIQSPEQLQIYAILILNWIDSKRNLLTSCIQKNGTNQPRFSEGNINFCGCDKFS